MTNLSRIRSQLEAAEGPRLNKSLADVRNELNQTSGPSRFDAFRSGLGDAASLGWGDELSGHVHAIDRSLRGDDYWSAYHQQADQSRSNLREAWDTHPLSTMGGMVVGTGATMALPVGVATRAASTAGRLGRAAASGAAFGGVAGAGAGVDPNERLNGAMIGTALGAGAGAAAHGVFGEMLPNAASGIANSGFGRMVAQMVPGADEVTRTNRALDDVVRTARRNPNLNVRDANDVASMMDQAAVNNPLQTVAEMLGESGVKRGVALTRLPGEAAQVAEDYLRPRSQGQAARLERELLGRAPSSGDDLERQLADEWDTRGNELYEPLMNAPANMEAARTLLTQPLQPGGRPMMQNPAVRNAIRQSMNALRQRIDTGSVQPGTVAEMLPRILHGAKVRLQNMVDYPHLRQSEPGMERMLNADAENLLNTFTRIVDEVVPGYNNARTQLATIGSAQRAIRAGRQAYDVRAFRTPEALRTHLDDMAEADRPYFMSGVEDVHAEKLSANRDGRVNIAGRMQDDRIMDRWDALYGPAEAQRMREVIARESDMFQNATRMRAAFNSPSTPAAAEGLDIASDAARIPADRNQLLSMLWNNSLGRIGEQHRDRLAQMYFSPVSQGQGMRDFITRALRERALRQAQIEQARLLGRTNAATREGIGWAGAGAMLYDPREERRE